MPTTAARSCLAALAVVAVVAVTGCGAGDTGPEDVGAAPVPVSAPTTLAPVGTGSTTVTLYFTRGDELIPARRALADRGDLDLLAADAVRALIAGPTDEEVAAGLGSEIPRGTRLLDVRIGDDRIATVDLSAEFETGGGTASIRARLGQVACTMDDLVELDVADGTRFLLDGRPVDLFSGEGIVLDGPVDCSDFQPRPTEGDAAPDCQGGWHAPPPGAPDRTAGLDLLRISAGTSDRFVVEDIRYFTSGADDVEHWYLKVRGESDPSFRGRFLVVRREGSGGVVAVAPFGTSGWESPDWAGFEGEGEPIAFPDLPGRWAGVRYDFVTGTGGPGTPGLAPELVGCLEGT